MNEQEEKQLDLEAMRNMLDNPHGRRILWKVISMCGVYKQSAENSGSWTYYNDGRRAIGLNLISDIVEADPEGYIRLQLEKLNKNKNLKGVKK